MSIPICEISGTPISLSEREAALRARLGAPAPRVQPKYTLQELCAFWQHFAVHRRTSDYSGKTIVSVFDEHCPYPVWHREEWIRFAKPPEAIFSFTAPFFEQLWLLFQRCPIPHNIGAGSENCEYTDDWWYSKNCYLCHSGLNSQDCSYCYRIIHCSDSRNLVFTFDSELSFELVNCHNCYSSLYLVNCRNCYDSAFLFDCRRCNHCLFCWNLRDKEYCVRNEQLSAEEYRRFRERWDLASRALYEQAVAQFIRDVEDNAVRKAVEVEMCIDSWGAYLENCKECENCYFLQDSESCVNYIRGNSLKDTLDSVGNLASELCNMTALVQDKCYSVSYSCDVVQSSHLEYCAHCFQCKHCFACCGLVGREYCIMNKQYGPEDYRELVGRIKRKLAADGLEGRFFPPYFAANPYEETIAAVHFPLAVEEQRKLGFRTFQYERTRPADALNSQDVPDSWKETDDSLSSRTFWDEASKRPFQITKADLLASTRLGIPLPDSFYARRLRELFSWMPCTGELRPALCSATGEEVRTHLPAVTDRLLLGPQAYNERIA